MLSQDLVSCAVSIGVLAGDVDEQQWAYLRLLRANLLAHAAQAKHLELGLSVARAAAGMAEPAPATPNTAPDNERRTRVTPFPVSLPKTQTTGQTETQGDEK